MGINHSPLLVGRGIFDVKNYLAVGDGVTDDSTAIQAAIDAAEAAGGGIVYAPPGLYAIGTTLTLQASNVELRFPFSALGDSVYERGNTFQLLTGAANSGQKVIPIADTSSFAVGERVYLGQTNALFESGVIASKVTNTSITVTSNLTKTHAAGTTVWKPWSPDRFGEPYANGLLWIGADGGTMLSISPDQSGSMTTALVGLRVCAALFAGVAPFTSVAAVGVELQGVHRSTFELWTWEFSSAGIHLKGVPIPPGPPTNYNDITVEGCHFPILGGFQFHRAGAILDLDNGGVYGNVFGAVHGHYKDGHGIYLHDGGDSNLFENVIMESYYDTVASLPAVYGYGVYLAPGSVDYQVPHWNTFNHLLPGAGNLVSPNGSSAARTAYGNEVRHFNPDISLVSGGVYVPPAVGSLSTLIWRYVGRPTEGTSFPASPVTGERFFRTDRGILYYYDGAQWLSAQLYEWTASLGLLKTGADSPVSVSTYQWANRPVAGGTDIWVVALDVSWQVQSGGTTLGASHKWTVRARVLQSNAVLGTANVSSGTSDGTPRTLATLAIGALVGTNGTNQAAICFDSEKTGTPGAFSAAGRLTYRLVG